jgi:hypothetical protein
VLLAPLVYSFWQHLRGRPAAAFFAFCLFIVITSPNSYFEHLDVPLLLHVRVLALLLAVLWLCVLSVRGAAARTGGTAT